MNSEYSHLDIDQKQILDLIKEIYKGETDLFMSTPNKYFKGRPPIEMLLNKNFTYFDPYINKA